MLEETKSNWQCVADLIKDQKIISCGPSVAHLFYQEPERLLHTLTCYKFATKLIGKNKRILDVGCQEGLGSYILAKECGFVHGMDLDASCIENASKNFQSSQLQFSVSDLSNPDLPLVDAVVYFSSSLMNLDSIASRLFSHGMAIVGFSPGQSIEKEMKRQFQFVFFFGVYGESIQVGSNGSYQIAVGCKKYGKVSS